MNRVVLIFTPLAFFLAMLVPSFCFGQENDGSTESNASGLVGLKFFSPDDKDKTLRPRLTRKCANGEIVFLGGASYEVRKSEDSGNVRSGSLVQAMFSAKLPDDLKLDRVTKVECKTICHCALGLTLERVHPFSNGAFLISATSEKIKYLTREQQDNLRFTGGHEIKKPGFYLLETDGIKKVDIPRSFLRSSTFRTFESPDQESVMAVISEKNSSAQCSVSLAEFTVKTSEFGEVIRVPIEGDSPSVQYADRNNLIVTDHIDKGGLTVHRIRNLGTNWEVQFPLQSMIYSLDAKHNSIVVLSEFDRIAPSAGGFDDPRITELNFKTGEATQEFDIEHEAGSRILPLHTFGWDHGRLGLGSGLASGWLASTSGWNVSDGSKRLFFWEEASNSKQSLLEVSLDDQKQVIRVTQQWDDFTLIKQAKRNSQRAVTWVYPFSLE